MTHSRAPAAMIRAFLRRLTLAALVALPLGACAGSDAPPMPASELPADIRDALAASGVPADAVSIHVQAAASGETRLRFNAERPRNPASVMKLLTTYAALEALGPAHTWETRAYADGPVRNGVLAGDLWLVGAGDPLLTAEDFWKLLGAVRRRGIEHIEGDLVLDAARFAPVERDPGAFDGEPYRAYNQPPHPLLVNFNAIELELEAAREQDMVRVSMHPPLGNLPVENRLRLESGVWCGGYRWHVDYEVVGGPRTPEAVLQGRYGRGCGLARLRRTALPVEVYVHGLFSALWHQWGGRFDGDWVLAEWSPAAAGAGPLVRHESQPLAEIVRSINKFSNNVMTRQLALALAARNADHPVTEADGRAAVREVLTGLGIDLAGGVIDEVAGLSRNNRLTVDQVADLLATARRSLVMPELVTSLPIAGTDGTLRNRLESGPEAGRARMKTGMIDDVAALAGYLRNAADEKLIVVVLINGDDVHRGRGTVVQDAIVRWAFRNAPG